MNNDPTTNLDFFRLAILKDILLNLVIDKITEVFIQTQLVQDFSLLARAKLWVTGFTPEMREVI